MNITLEAAAADSDGTIKKRHVLRQRGAGRQRHHELRTASRGVNVAPRQLHADRDGAGRQVRDHDVGTGAHLCGGQHASDRGHQSPAEGATFTSPAEVTIEANAADSDGAVQKVEFFANGVSIGTDTVAPYSVTWKPAAGSHVLKRSSPTTWAATTTSALVNIMVNTIPGRINVALVIERRRRHRRRRRSSPNYPASGAINGDRQGLNWGAGGGWNDGTQNAGPDWIEVAFTA